DSPPDIRHISCHGLRTKESGSPGAPAFHGARLLFGYGTMVTVPTRTRPGGLALPFASRLLEACLSPSLGREQERSSSLSEPRGSGGIGSGRKTTDPDPRRHRSEEHTSELQSLTNL